MFTQCKQWCTRYQMPMVSFEFAELLRENKRMLDKSIREIDRERQALQAQEKKLIMEIKKSAKQGQMGAVKVMAKDLIRTRHQIEKFYKLKSQLQGVSLRIQTLKSTQAMGEAMKGVTKAMGTMNRQMNLPALQRIMQEFEMQNEKMEMVLDEIGININSELVNAPSSAIAAAPATKNNVPQAEATGNEDAGIDSDLQASWHSHNGCPGILFFFLWGVNSNKIWEGSHWALLSLGVPVKHDLDLDSKHSLK
nr:vacuolar protein sorting-associated protein 2 homolog 1 [Ipomoea batatas]